MIYHVYQGQQLQGVYPISLIVAILPVLSGRTDHSRREFHITEGRQDLQHRIVRFLQSGARGEHRWTI